MTIRLVHYCPDSLGYQQVITEKDVDMIMFEDQRHLGNGMWLHCLRKNGEDTSISFEPNEDWFDIF